MYRTASRSRPAAPGRQPGAGGAPCGIRGASGRKRPGESAACCPGSRRRGRWWARGVVRDPGAVPERRGRRGSGRRTHCESRPVPGRQPGGVGRGMDGRLVRPPERRGRNLPRPSGLPEAIREEPPGRFRTSGRPPARSYGMPPGPGTAGEDPRRLSRRQEAPRAGSAGGSPGGANAGVGSSGACRGIAGVILAG